MPFTDTTAFIAKGTKTLLRITESVKRKIPAKTKSQNMSYHTKKGFFHTSPQKKKALFPQAKSFPHAFIISSSDIGIFTPEAIPQDTDDGNDSLVPQMGNIVGASFKITDISANAFGVFSKFITDKALTNITPANVSKVCQAIVDFTDYHHFFTRETQSATMKVVEDQVNRLRGRISLIRWSRLYLRCPTSSGAVYA